MATNVLEAITEQYHSLTRSGKKLADYIFSHTTEAQYLSITSLAENCDVSEATITRFCRGLGIPSYNAFKLALAQAQADHITDLGDPTDCREPITSKDSVSTMCKKIHASNITSLNETLDLLDERCLTRASHLLSDAQKVFCFGQGGSMVMAMEAWARFSTVSSKFIHIEDSHMQAMTVSLASSKDVILFFSYSGSTKDMEDVFVIAQERNIPIILITHFPKSRAAEFANVVLLCGFNESPLQSGSIAAKMGQLFLIECLFYGYCSQNPGVHAAARSATARAIAQKLL